MKNLIKYVSILFIGGGVLNLIYGIFFAFYVDPSTMIFYAMSVAAGIGGLIYLRNDGQVPEFTDDEPQAPVQQPQASNPIRDEYARMMVGNNSSKSGLNVINGKIWNGDGHILTVGGSRSGKGTCIIAPALTDNSLMHPDAPSFFVLDPKGENLNIAGDYLRRAGYQVCSINPWDIPEIMQFGQASYNPLLRLVGKSDHQMDDEILLIANNIVPQSSHQNRYFDDAARDMIVNYMRHVLTQNEDEISFRTIHKYVSFDKEGTNSLAVKMFKNESFDGVVKDYSIALVGLANGNGDQFLNISRTAQAYMQNFGNMGIKRSLNGNDFNAGMLNDRKVAVFACIPSKHIEANKTWIKVVFGSFLGELTDIYNQKRKKVIILDELFQLGHFSDVERFMSYGAQYATVWSVFQTIGNIQKNYDKNWETFTGNSVIKHWIGIDDSDTREYLSKRFGEKTVDLGKNADGSPKFDRVPFLSPIEVGQVTREAIIYEDTRLSTPAKMPRTPYWQQNGNGKRLR